LGKMRYKCEPIVRGDRYSRSPISRLDKPSATILAICSSCADSVDNAACTSWRCCAGPWAERARRELRATGVVSQAPRPQQWTSLSPQELQIALLAAEGLTNREIAQRLYLSHRTVSSHLYRIFPKLGITSRAQLRSVMTPVEARPAAGA